MGAMALEVGRSPHPLPCWGWEEGLSRVSRGDLGGTALLQSPEQQQREEPGAWAST